jgi:hypothetical protein
VLREFSRERDREEDADPASERNAASEGENPVRSDGAECGARAPVESGRRSPTVGAGRVYLMVPTPEESAENAQRSEAADDRFS